MIVSNFWVSSAERRTTRYSLQVTNLDASDITFTVEAHVSLEPNTPFSSRIVFSDLYTEAYFRKGNVFVNRAVVSIRSQTTKVIRLSAETGSSAEGFVSLRIPPVRSKTSFRTVPQVDRKVRILLHARREDTRPGRVSYIVDPQGYIPYRTGTDDDYSSESITISTGQAENEIDPEGRWLFGPGTFTKLSDEFASGKVTVEEMAGALPEEKRLPALLDLLEALERADASELEALNAILARDGSPLRLRTER